MVQETVTLEGHIIDSDVLRRVMGKIVEEGSPGRIFRHPTHERTQAFLKKVIAAGHRV